MYVAVFILICIIYFLYIGTSDFWYLRLYGILTIVFGIPESETFRPYSHYSVNVFTMVYFASIYISRIYISYISIQYDAMIPIISSYADVYCL